MGTRTESYLRNKVFNSYLLAGFLSAVAMLIGPLLIRLIAGNFLIGADLAAINLTEPVQRLANALVVLLSSGAIVLASNELSRIDDRASSRIFTFSLASCTVAGVLIALTLPLYHETVVGLLCKNAELIPSVRSYSRILLLSSPVLMTLPVLAAFISLDGSPSFSYITILASQVLSIGIAVIMIVRGNPSISGLATANLIGNATGCAMGIFYFFKKSIHFKFCRSLPSPQKTGEVLKLGVPETLSPFLDSVLVFVANAKAIELYGKAGADVMAVCLSMVYVFALIIESFSLTLKPFGSYLTGLEDIGGYNKFFRKNLFVQQLIIIATLIPMILFHGKIMECFGISDPDTLRLGIMAFPIFVFHYFLCGFTELYTGNFQILKKTGSCFVVSVSQTVFRIIFLIIFSKAATGLFWWSYPLGIAIGIVSLLVCLLIPSIKCGQALSWTGALFDKVKSCRVFSIRCTVSDIKDKLSPIFLYVRALDIPDAAKDKSEHCIEEVLLNTVLFADMKNRESHSSDVKIIEKEKSLTIIFYDDGVRFNPFDNIVPEVDLGLEMISKMNVDISYSYLFLQNIINISIQFDK